MSNNVEVEVINWLSGLADLSGWAVSAAKPSSPPDNYILVSRTGGEREAMVLDRAEVLIEVYHKSSQIDASNMANLIADHVPYLKNEVVNITRSDVNSTTYLADTLTQYYRYQVYCDVYIRRPAPSS